MIIKNSIITEAAKTYIMPDIYLRPATKKDIPLMYEWELESINKNLRTQKRVVKLIEEDVRQSVPDTQMIMYKNSIIGMLTACYIDNGEWWYIGEIYIIEEHRCKGLGTKILQREIANHDKIVLKVATDNVRAKALYESLGFKVCDADKYTDMYIMRLEK